MNDYNQNIKNAILYKKENNNLEQINNSLIEHIKIIELENKNLKEALSDLNSASKEKDSILERSQKIIKELQLKYNEGLEQYKILENNNKKLEENNKSIKNAVIEDNKNKNLIAKLDKVNNSLKKENEELNNNYKDLKHKLESKTKEISNYHSENKILLDEIKDLKMTIKNMNSTLESKELVINEEKQSHENTVQLLNKKEEEVKILIKLSQDLNNENKLNIDEVTKQSTNAVNLLYNNFNNNLNSLLSSIGNNNNNSNINNKAKNNNCYFTYDKLLELYSPSLFIPKNEISKLIKDNNISVILGEAITKDFKIPDIFINNNKSNSVVLMPLEIFYNYNLKIELLKTEMLSGYLREMKIVEFIENNFNKNIVEKILNKKVSLNPCFNKINNHLKNKKCEDFMDFFIIISDMYSDASNYIDNLESTNNKLNKEILALKNANNSFKDKNLIYEEQISSLKENIRSINNIYNNKITNLNNLCKDLIKTQKLREDKINSYNTLLLENKENELNKKINNLSEELDLKISELEILKNENQKIKSYTDKSRINMSLSRTKILDKSKKDNEYNSQESSKEYKNASYLEIELEKTKNEYNLAHDKIDVLNAKLQDNEAEIKDLNNQIINGKKELDKQISHNNYLNIEINNLKNDLAVVNEKVVISSNRINTKLNQSTILNKSIEKSRYISHLEGKGNNNTSINILGKDHFNQENTFDENRSVYGNLSKVKSGKEMNISTISYKSNLSPKKGILSKKNNFIHNNKFSSLEIKKYSFHILSSDRYNYSNSFGNQNINESFNKDNYINKKKEICDLRNQITRLKNENVNLIKEINDLDEKFYNNDNSNNKKLKCLALTKLENINYIKTKKDNLILDKYIQENISNLRNELTYNKFKDCCNFYSEYKLLIDKINLKIEDVKSKLNKLDKQVNNSINVDYDSNKERVIKTTYLKDMIYQIQKLISNLLNNFNSLSSEFQNNTSNLNKIFNFIDACVYQDDLENCNYNNDNFNSINSNIKKQQIAFGKNSSCIYDLTLKLITDFNKVFTKSEMKRLKSSYENKNILNIVETFRVNCELIKSNILETKFDTESDTSVIMNTQNISSKLNYNFNNKNYDFNDRLLTTSMNNQKESSEYEPLNTSYRLVNEKVYKLKKLEFDYSNLCEVIKNYVVVQEIIVKHLFCDNQQSIDDDLLYKENFKTKIEVLDKLLYYVNDALFYKCETFEEDHIIIRKVIIRLLTNQKKLLLIEN